MLVHVDCNNFFVSCERAVNPTLENKPVIVVSNQGGIVLARSNEAKALGIPMGAPLFDCEALCKKYNIYIFPCNFALYRELSYAVMETLSSFTPDLEKYSVDEAFMQFLHITPEEVITIRREILKRTKIPTSLGIATTKTLCKGATYFAKRKLEGFHFMQPSDLELLPIEEVWGIGGKLSERLKKKSIYTAQDLCLKTDTWLQRELSIVGLRLAFELRGVSCFTLQEMRDPRKSISCARSFAKPLVEYEDIAQILSLYVEDVTRQLREEKQFALSITVWLKTSVFTDDTKKYHNVASFVFSEPTNFLPQLIRTARELLKSIYREGFIYKKVGVMLADLVREGQIQQDLFEERCDRAKKEKLMQLIDQSNGKITLGFKVENQR